ncbi:uncharacterized transporter slc-17.2 [Aplysia californica]|uniref:Uncharacterized transporter slc-17.2 n=1 Tax=Aplysia californica TaxID=6500 RepID=A0ABM0K3B3_APLCA|nr:uncharacterized transporter slc-17.2 [Aplysia californica]
MGEVEPDKERRGEGSVLPPKGPPWWRSTRFMLALLASFGYGNFFLQRINLSMGVVCMVNHTAVDLLTSHHQGTLQMATGGGAGDELTMMNYNYSEEYSANDVTTWGLVDTGNNSFTDGTCSPLHAKELQKEDGQLVWSKSTQGIILGGLYWGYLLLQLPSQRIIQHLGCKRLSLGCVLLMSLLTMALPAAARLSPWLMMSIRVAQGLLSALGVPAIYCMWGAWAPPQERTTLISICFSGSMIASAIVYPSSGLLCRFGFAGGWPSVFYVFGIVGLVWCVLWMFLMYETPDTHPRIDPREREFIKQSIGGTNKENRGAIPWLKIFSSIPVWAVVVAQLGYNWAFFMLLAMLPQYMKEVLQLDIQSNGFYSMLPYVALSLCTNIWGSLCDCLLRRKVVSLTGVRKLSTAVGTVVPGILYVIISFLDCSQALWVVLLMTFAIGISGTNLQGFLINPYDIAPRYATAVLCLSNTIAVGSGIVSPYVVAAMTVNKTREEWQGVFFLTSGIGLACLVFYLIFGSGVEMEWAKAPKDRPNLDAKPTNTKAVPSSDFEYTVKDPLDINLLNKKNKQVKDTSGEGEAEEFLSKSASIEKIV